VKVITACVASAGLLMLGACQPAPARSNGATGAEVRTAIVDVQPVDWPSTFDAGGIVRARQTAAVSSRIVAPVLDVRVRAGDRVRRGDVLVVLDGRELRANAARAAAALGATRQGVNAAESESRAADAAVTLARATHGRIQGLHARNSATAQELDEAVAALSAADGRAGGAHARVAEAGAALDAAQAASEAASIAVTYATLTAPFDGVVANRVVDPGALAAPAAELLTVEETSAYRLEVRIDGSRASFVRVGAEAQVRLDAGDVPADAAWSPAKIVEIARLDPASHSFLVKLDLARRDGLRSGQFGRVRLSAPSRRTLAVPASSILHRGQLAMLFAVDATGVARLRAVTPGETRDRDVEILAGVAPGDRVVVAPPIGLEDGMKVQTAGARP
jgi:RND family efflux transporter MFP subunit